MRIGSLFSGYGGLELGVQQAIGGTVAWHSDIDPGPSKILAHHWPTVPNLGDITKVDWATTDPVDVITAGFPCQPVSHAGQRAGVTDERWLFDDILAALRHLDPPPRLLLLENVLGLLSANGGDAMARVVEGLASIGWVGAWRTLAASDVGAAHQRRRVFILAWPAADAASDGRHEGRPESARLVGRPDAPLGGHADVTLLPTPAVNDMGRAYTPDTWDAWTDRMKNAHGNGNGHGKSLHIEALRMLPTPTAADAGASGGAVGSANVTLTDATVRTEQRGLTFGDYAPAIARWEDALGRHAPSPTEPTGKAGAHRLSPRFVEWLMGLPAGHVTDVPDLSRNAQLKALGNGVVPQQAAAALKHLLDIRTTETEAA